MRNVVGGPGGVLLNFRIASESGFEDMVKTWSGQNSIDRRSESRFVYEIEYSQ